MFPNKVLTASGLIDHVAVNVNGYERAVLDVELLSRCDEVIITGGSTFGFASSLRSARFPLFVNGKQGSTNCERFTFSNPSRTETYLLI
jgi:hypothetical protein